MNGSSGLFLIWLNTSVKHGLAASRIPKYIFTNPPAPLSSPAKSRRFKVAGRAPYGTHIVSTPGIDGAGAFCRSPSFRRSKIVVIPNSLAIIDFPESMISDKFPDRYTKPGRNLLSSWLKSRKLDTPCMGINGGRDVILATRASGIGVVMSVFNTSRYSSDSSIVFVHKGYEQKKKEK
jgi:hypothetical protein